MELLRRIAGLTLCSNVDNRCFYPHVHEHLGCELLYGHANPASIDPDHNSDYERTRCDFDLDPSSIYGDPDECAGSDLLHSYDFNRSNYCDRDAGGIYPDCSCDCHCFWNYVSADYAGDDSDGWVI